MVLEKLSKIVAEQLGMEQSKITMNTSLKDDLLADYTIADVVNYIEKKSA